MNCKLICMSFDGEYQTERPVFTESDKAWEYSGDLGSKWFFYPFHFVVSESGKTIVSAPYPMEHLIGLRVKTVAKHFATTAKRPELAVADVDTFAFTV